MKYNKRNFERVLKEANEYNGLDSYVKISIGNRASVGTLITQYTDTPIINILYANFDHGLYRFEYKSGYFYLVETKFGEDGKTLPKKQYRKVVMYHKKYARKDIIINPKEFDYEIVGYKRKTTHIPSGVYVSISKMPNL